MSSRRKLHMAFLYNKIVLFKSPPFVFNKIVYKSHVYNIIIRGYISPLPHRTSMFQRSLSYNIYKTIKQFGIVLFTKDYKRILNISVI